MSTTTAQQKQELINQAVEKMNELLLSRKSVLTVTGSKEPLTKVKLNERINASVISVYEERCSDTGKIKATWVFDSNKLKFELNQIRRYAMFGRPSKPVVTVRGFNYNH